jgi:hypothetical protein
MRCDQCHADSGIKRKSKKTFNKSMSFEAEFEVILNGAKMNLCQDHHDKLNRSLDRRKTTHEYASRNIQ